MAVDQPNVIDVVSKEKNGDIVLTISDHLDWRDTEQHLAILREKINTYLSFLEDGEIYERYPDAKGHNIHVEIGFFYQPNLQAQSFLSEAKMQIEGAGFSFRYRLFAATPYTI